MSIFENIPMMAQFADQWPRIVQTLTDEDVIPFIAILFGLMILLVVTLIFRRLDRKTRLKAREINLEDQRSRKSINNPFSGAR